MPTLTERLDDDYKTAMKAQERLRIDTLRMVKAALQKVTIDKRVETLADADVIQVLGQQAKQRQETLDSAVKNNRPEIADQARRELALIRSYLPTPISEADVKRLIDEAIAAVGSQQGPIMKYVMGKAAGSTDGNTVNRLVRERLSQGTAA